MYDKGKKRRKAKDAICRQPIRVLEKTWSFSPPQLVLFGRRKLSRRLYPFRFLVSGNISIFVQTHDGGQAKFLGIYYMEIFLIATWHDPAATIGKMASSLSFL